MNCAECRDNLVACIERLLDPEETLQCRTHLDACAACRTEARRRQHRAANRRYQQSPEGRLDHRDRQQHYRERQCRPRVTDQSSLSVISPAPFGCGETITAPAVVALRVQSPNRLETSAGPWLRCSLCGRPGRFVDPFPQIPRRR